MGYAKRSANKASNMAIDEEAAKVWMTYMNLSRLNQDQSRNPDSEGEESQDSTSSDEDMDIDPPTAADTSNENDEDVVSPQESGLKFHLKGSLILLFSILLIFFDKKKKKKKKKNSASSDDEKPKIGPNKVSDFLLFWIIPYLLSYTQRKVREIKEHHRKRLRPEFPPVCRKSTLDIIEGAMLSCGVSGELKATIVGKYKDFYSTENLEYEYELLQSPEGTPIILVPKDYKVTHMPLKLKDVGTKWRELGDTNLLTVFLSKFIKSRKIQRDFFDSLDFVKNRQGIDYAIILPDEKTFVELKDAFERESHDYLITPKVGRNLIVPRLGLVTTTEKHLRVCFTYFQGSKGEQVAAMFRAIGAHFLDHFCLIILHGLSRNKSDPNCNIGSLYPVGIARKVTFRGNSVQLEKKTKKSESKNTGKKDFSASQGKFCRAEFPITYNLWETETRNTEVVKNLISRAEASLGFNPNFERDALLHVAYATKSHEKKLKEEPFGASMAPNKEALSKYQIRAVNLDGAFLGNVVRSGRKENIAVVLAIKDVCGREGCCFANVRQAIQSIIVNFVRAAVVAGLPKVYPSEPDEEDRVIIESGSSEDEDESPDDEPCVSGQNVAVSSSRLFSRCVTKWRIPTAAMEQEKGKESSLHCHQTLF
ncbi:uncharacterized protein LOC111331115 isoform X2 [Stylophora pistillata]|uniref:uncharacterized protein LOC111331115 isoform X2 n=1 Tax=Stylophora pistillata TaxID=50429 RepID=UPI000C0571F5|nr:uncharacterized protein LOC111331115 isoform X2 [Stylophora pistillata]